MTTQIVAAASSDPRAARRDAAAQVGFYSTPKGYDLLFPDGQFAAERAAARDALARGDVPGVIAAGDAMVEERAVFGTPEDVAGQLRRYADVIDWAILYPPHFGVDPERIHANELSLIEVASGWTSLRAQPKRVQVVTLDLIDPGQQGVEVPGHAAATVTMPLIVTTQRRIPKAPTAKTRLARPGVRPLLRGRVPVVLPEHAAEVGGVEETPPCGQHRHATVAFGRIFQVAAGRLEALVPDQAADRPRLVREQPVQRAGRHVMRSGDAGPRQPEIVQVRSHVLDDVGPYVAGGIDAGEIAVIEQRAGEQGRTRLAELGGGRRAQGPRVRDGTDHEVRQHAPGTVGRGIHPVHPAVQIVLGQVYRVTRERHDGARPRALEPDPVGTPGVVDGEFARVETDLVAALPHGGPAV
jgi:hypothetical protein